ncbi:MAG: restriction endonuclease, partial [Nitrospirae bacterium]
MAGTQDDLAKKVRGAVRHFWRTRERQARAQGGKTGERDRGARSAVTGGAHLDGFADLIRKLVVEAGVGETAVHRRSRVELPGYYRAEKQWDLVIVVDGRLLATVEFKAQ